MRERDNMCSEDSSAASQQAAKARYQNSELRGQVEISASEITKLRQREAALAAQVASILAPVSVMCRTRPLESYKGDDDGAIRSALQVDGGEITVEGVGGVPKRKFQVDRVL